MAAVFVQSVIAPWTTSTFVPVAITPSAGSLLVIAVLFEAGNSGNDITDISDDRSQVYNLVDTFTEVVSSLNQRLSIYYVKNAQAGVTNITVGFGTSSVNIAAVIVHEYSGVDTISPLDVHNIQKLVTPGTGTDAVTSPSVVTTTPGQIIFGVAKRAPDGAIGYSAGSGFIAIRQSQALHGATEDKVQVSAGSIAATFTADTDITHYVAVATFKAAAVAGDALMAAGIM